MKKTFTTLAVTGVLTLTALAGTVATASAATPAMSPNYSTRIGPFSTATDCETYVAAVGEWGVYDCERTGGQWYAYVP